MFYKNRVQSQLAWPSGESVALEVMLIFHVRVSSSPTKVNGYEKARERPQEVSLYPCSGGVVRSPKKGVFAVV